MRETGASDGERDLAAWCAAAARDNGTSVPTAPAEQNETEGLLRLLCANRLGPAIDRALSRTALTTSPSTFVNEIRADAREAADRGLSGLAAVRTLADALDARAIQWMLWKGPALAMQVWGEATRRRFSDLDIVVAPESRAAALAEIERAGWRVRDGLPPRTAHAIHSATCAYPLDRAGAPLVELHWGFAGRLYPAVAQVEEVLSRAERVSIAGREVRTPGGADALLLLAMHATKHGWSQAEEVVSFSRLVARDPAALIAARVAAAAAGVPRVIALAERLVARLIGGAAQSPTSSAASGAVSVSVDAQREQIAIDAMADACIARMLAGDGAWRRTTAWSLSWMSRAADRRRFIIGSLWRPTPMEWQWLPLPSALVGAYPLVRLTRLVLRSARLTR